MNSIFKTLLVLCIITSSLTLYPARAAPVKTLIVGHRGANAVAPENTFPSFNMAIQLKADGIETDIRITKDNVLILFHDSNVKRTTNGTGEVSELTWDYIKNLDAGSWFDKSFADTRVPQVDEFLAYIAGIVQQKPNFFVVLDIKAHKVAAPLRALVNKYGLDNNLFISVWNNEDLIDFVYHGFKLNMWTGDQPNILTWKRAGFFDEQKQFGIHGYSLEQKTISKSFVEASQGVTMPVFLWTPITTHEMETAITLAVDGVIVNDIQKMRDIIGSYYKPSLYNLTLKKSTIPIR